MGESDDGDNNLESDVCQQCEIELNKYKKLKTKIPKDGNYPDALAYWKNQHTYPLTTKCYCTQKVSMIRCAR